MNFLRVVTTTVMTLSIVGCSMGRNCVVDPCGAYSTEPVIGGGILRFFALPSSSSSCCGQSYGMDPSYCDSCGNIPLDGGCSCGQCARLPKKCGCGGIFGRKRCRSACSANSYDCGGAMSGGCGCGQPGSPMNSQFGMPSGCGCGQSHAPFGAPTMGTPAPNALPETNTNPAPAPPAVTPSEEAGAPAAMNRTTHGMPTQTVSYEEFQRLPGTIISGPGATTNHSPNIVASTPQTSNSPTRNATRPVNFVPQPMIAGQNQQAVWIPAKP